MLRRLKNFNNDVNQAQIITFFAQMNTQQIEETLIAIDIPPLFRILAYLKITNVFPDSNLKRWHKILQESIQTYTLTKQQFNERKFMKVYYKDSMSNYSFQSKLFEYKQVLNNDTKNYNSISVQSSVPNKGVMQDQLLQPNNMNITQPQNPYEYRHLIHQLEQNIKKDIDRLFSSDNYFINHDVRMEIGQIVAIYCYQHLDTRYIQGLHEVCAICYRIVEHAIKNNPKSDYTGTELLHREVNYLDQDKQSNFMYYTSDLNNKQEYAEFSDFCFLELISKQNQQALTYLLLSSIADHFHLNYLYKNEDQISLISEYFNNFVLQNRDPALFEHLQRLHVENTHFERCFKVLFVREVALQQAERLWDALIVYNNRVKMPNTINECYINIPHQNQYNGINYKYFFVYFDIMFYIYQINKQKLLSSDYGQAMTIYSMPLLNGEETIQSNKNQEHLRLQQFLKIIYENLFMKNNDIVHQTSQLNQVITPVNLHVNDIWQDACKSTYDPVNLVCDIVLAKIIDIQTSHRLGDTKEVEKKLDNLINILQVQPTATILQPFGEYNNFDNHFPPKHRLIEFEIMTQQQIAEQK